MTLEIFKSRKGQLTIFIIIGLMILFGSVLLLYVKKQVAQRDSFEDMTGTVPVEIAPVKEYIEKCMYDLGKDAIIRIGETGGYLEADPLLIKVNSMDPTDNTEGVELVEGTGVVTPYWYYLKGDNSCQKLIEGQCEFETFIPELKKESVQDLSIENQISMYVEERFDDCIDEFTAFSDMSTEVTELKKPIFDTTITYKEVQLKLKYPITITKGNTESEMEYFSTDFDVQLEYAYWLAYQIVKKEMENYFLEQSLANLINIFGGMDRPIPPMYGGMNLAADAPMDGWSKKTVSEELQNILYPYTSNFKVTNTLSQYRIIPEDEEDTWDFVINKMNYLIDLDFDYFFPLDVEFIYMPNWPVYVDVTPSAGDRIMPEKGGMEFLEYFGLGMTRYDFSFDVSYPVLIKITDYNAFNKEGYTFYIAIESNMRNNRALMDMSSDNYFQSNPLLDNEVPRLMCSEEGKRTGDITVNAYDALTKEPLKGAEVTSTFKESSCIEGITDSDGTYTGKFQSGIGDLDVKKPDYLDFSKDFVFGVNSKDVVTAYLYPKQEVDVKLYETVFTQKSQFNEYKIRNHTASEDVTVLLRFERIPDNLSKENIHATIAFTEDDSDQKTIDLYPGSYKTSMTYMNERNFTSPGSVDCNPQDCINFNSTSRPLNIRIDLDDPDHHFIVAPERLYSSNQLVVNIPIPEVYDEQYVMTINDMGMVDMTETYKRFYDMLEPELK